MSPLQLLPIASPRATTEPPPWVDGLVGPLEASPWREEGEGLALRAAHGEDMALVSVRLEGARALPAFAFQRRTADAYERIGRHLRTCRARHPVRLWNFIPGILEPLGALPHRYMVFNAGRFAAYTRWYRHRDRFDRYVATASGVGHGGDDLVIHCLAARAAGMPVENPRQVAAYRYSARYGPQPPCFARATRLDARGARSLLVGGTASVRGEDSLYAGDVAAQIEETLRNLAAVAAAGAVAARSTRAPDEAGEGELERYRSLRVYHVRDEDLPGIRAAIAASFRRLELLELVSADLCRPELLVEIEGTADLASPAPDDPPPALTVV